GRGVVGGGGRGLVDRARHSVPDGANGGRDRERRGRPRVQREDHPDARERVIRGAERHNVANEGQPGRQQIVDCDVRGGRGAVVAGGDLEGSVWVEVAHLGCLPVDEVGEGENGLRGHVVGIGEGFVPAGGRGDRSTVDKRTNASCQK